MGWLDQWLHRKSHAVNGSTAGAQTNYQVRVRVLYASGADSGEDVYLAGKCRTDFGDVRFTKSDGETLLDYWMEEKVDGNYAIFWVEVDSIPASPGSTTIYIYYGKGDQTSISNPDNTFPFFEDFPGSGVDPAKWTSHTNAGGSISVAGSILTLQVANQLLSRAELRSVSQWGVDYAIRSRAQFPAVQAQYYRLLAFSNHDDATFPVTSSSESGQLLTFDTTGYVASRHLDVGTYVATAWTTGVYRVFEVRRTASKIIGAEEGGNTGQSLTNIPTGNLRICPAHETNNPPNTRQFLIDWILVRVFADPEPSHGVWGSEENLSGWVLGVDIRFSSVDPPTPEPRRSVFDDIATMPDPLYLGLTVRIFNDDDVGLYMRVDGSAPGWTLFNTFDLGLWGAATNAYRNLANLGIRPKPAAALTEEITVRLRAYTDAGYSSLKWTKERKVTMVFIDSGDGSWTQDDLDDFEGGTQEGWAAANEYANDAGYPQKSLAIDYYLSPGVSLRMIQRRAWQGPGDPIPTTSELRARLYKSVTTPNRNQVFAVFNIRLYHDWTGSGDSAPRIHYVSFQRDGTGLVFLGRPVVVGDATDYLPMSIWMRVVTPLPKNTTMELRIVVAGRLYSQGTAWYGYLWTWLDDFKIISKD